MAFGHDPQWGEEVDKMILKLLWSRKREGQVHREGLELLKNGLLWILPTVDSKFSFLKK
jgi:hypothetical protein